MTIPGTTRRTIAVAVFSVIGATAAFDVGAYVGGRIDGTTRSVSVARIPVTALTHAAEPTPAAEVAAK